MSSIFNQCEPWEANFPPTATESDILSCFRLLLGRKPGRAEWPAHVWRVGEDLTVLVSSYLNSQEFANRHLVGRQLGQWELVELPNFKLYASAEDSIGKVIIQAHNYEPHVSKMFFEYLRPGVGVLDIGANIGYFSLLAASLVGPSGFVQSWEPSSSNVKMLYASQLASKFGNIEIVQAAATDKPELLRYFRNSSNGNVAGVENTNPEEMLSAETVMGLPIDDFVPPDAQISFVKIDVEGHEFKALSGALKTLERNKPVVVSEFCPASLQQASGVSGREYLEFFVRLGYDFFVITENGPIAGSINDVLDRYERSGTDHIDLLLRPLDPLQNQVLV